MGKPKIIYIMGCGRSGTTILDIILGNHNGFLSVGEMNASKQAWQEKRFCSCGFRVTTCEIWRQFGSKFFNTYNQNDYNKMYVYQRNFERQRFLWKQIFSIRKVKKIRAYHLYIHKMFSTLIELSSCNTVIDSSKSVGRAIALLKNDKVDVKVIHLVRDPRGLYYSYKKKNVITPAKKLCSVASYWNTTNLLCELTRLYYGHKRVIRVRYEDLASSPNKTIDEIQDFICENLSDVKDKISSGEPIKTGHVASGNRIRTQNSTLTLKPDLEWKNKVGALPQAILNILCFPLMLMYGYFNK